MKTLTLLLVVTALVSTFAVPSVFAKANFSIINADGANEGFNDPTPAVPVGGNSGTTVGQQRLIAFAFAADIWECILDSDQTIRVRAQFNPLTCTPTGATLGSTGAQSVWRDFPGAPLAATWYADSEADALSNLDLGGAGIQDMNSQFNSNLGMPTCLPTSPWYYGLDNNPPPGAIDLVVVLLHEFGHGLGFFSTVNRLNGNLLSGFIDVYSRHLYDNTAGLHWDAMTSAQRLASITNNQNLVWDGPAVNADGADNLCHMAQLVVTAPPAVAGTYVAPLAAFSACNPNVSGPVELVVDGLAPTSDACEPVLNNLTGKIAILDRGTCTFVIKVLNAQNAGAIGAIVVNNVAGAPIEMGGLDPAITIPAVMISLPDGNAIKAELVNGVVATIGTNLGAFAGADNTGHLKMYAPNPSAAGSSTSHWDTSARPNLLMEPAINAGLDHSTDVTPLLLDDIDWNFNAGPTAVCRDIVVEGDPGCDPVPISANQVNNGSSDPNGDPLTMTLDPPGPYGSGHHTVTLNVTDGCETSSCEADIFIDCPVPVKLTAMRVDWEGSDALLHWEVTDAVDHAGFEVYRAVRGEERAKISTNLLSGQDRYDFRDRKAPAGGADYWVAERSRTGTQTWYGPVVLLANARPAVLSLGNIAPNPFRYQTRISYSLPDRVDALLTIHDLQGRVVRQLVGAVQEAGQYEVTWDGKAGDGAPAPAGIYFARLLAGGELKSQKVMLTP